VGVYVTAVVQDDWSVLWSFGMFFALLVAGFVNYFVTFPDCSPKTVGTYNSEICPGSLGWTIGEILYGFGIFELIPACIIAGILGLAVLGMFLAGGGGGGGSSGQRRRYGVLVTNLPSVYSESDVRDVFSECGVIVAIGVDTNLHGAIVEYSTESEAREAVRCKDGSFHWFHFIKVALWTNE
jgi:hypothetical protein